MRAFDVDTDIAAPAETVFAVMSDHRRYVDWTQAKAVTIERDGDPAPNGLGAVRVFAAGPSKVREEVTRFEPPTRLDYRLVSGVPVRRYDATMLVDALGPDRCRLRWHGEVEARIPGTEALLAKTFTKAVARFAAGIKDAAEAMPAGGGA